MATGRTPLQARQLLHQGLCKAPQHLRATNVWWSHTPLHPRLKIPRSNYLQRPQCRFNGTSRPPNHPTPPNPGPHLGSPEPTNLGLTQRFRKLSREYGWSAVGIYFLLSALDFPFCFLAVRIIGTERIGYWEHVVVGMAWKVFTLDGRMRNPAQATQDAQNISTDNSKGTGGNADVGRSIEDDKARGGVVAMTQQSGKILEQAQEGQGWSWGVEEADQANNKSDATIWTQLALAYAIHKSFIFLRIPATIAVTPKVVKVLRGWGWNVGKMPKRVTGQNTPSKPSTSDK